MIIDEMKQGSLQWHEHRAKYRNASEAAVIMGCQPKFWNTSKRILWEQKQGLRGSNVDSNNPEGTRSQTWKDAEAGRVAEHYRWQLIHQDHVIPTEMSYFFVYISDDQFICLTHESTEEDTAALLSAWDDFSASEPEPDFVLMEDAHMQVLVEEHQLLIDRQKHLKTQLEQVESTMKSKAGDKNVIAFGCKIQTINRKGSVDYKKIENLKDVDLEQYRKPASTYQKISYAKKEA